MKYRFQRKKTIPKPQRKAVKVPAVMQMEALECGAASLCMILAYYRRWVPLEEMRAACGVSRNGSNAQNIYLAAENYGLKVKAFSYEMEELMEEATFPCIIHWEFQHFVVLNGFKKGKACINDPARGCIEVSMEEFDESFTGVCLTFEPGEDFQMGGTKKSMLEFCKKRLRGTESIGLYLLLISTALAFLSILQPIFSSIFVDRLLEGQTGEWIQFFAVGIAGVTLLQILLSWISQDKLRKIRGKLAVSANAKFMWHVLRLPVEFFTQRMAGDIAARQKANQDIAAKLIQTFIPMILNFLMLIFYLIVIFRYSPILALIGVFSTLLNVLAAQKIAEKRTNITRVMMRDQGNLDGITYAGIEMIETIKASGADNGFFEKWAGIQASVNTQKTRYTEVSTLMGMIPMLVSSISDTLILALGAWFVMQGRFTVGMVLAFQGFMLAFREPVEDFISAGKDLQEMRSNMERVEDVLEYPTDPFTDQDPLLEEGEYDKLDGSVELKDVTFGYSKLSDPLIEHFNLSVQPGQRVAIVGASGCGKSTISKLICGLYQPWEGEILFGGKKASEIHHQVFTGSLAVVDQDIILFEDTIANNIKMWDSTIEDYEMILAARDAQLHEDIMNRDGGYQYRILDGGRDFSGGQRQRLEIARVLAQDPTIILMDEATSALDAKTEYDVVNSIKARGITCIVVAHRLSTIQDCDEIIVMDKGKIAERGRHAELMEAGGLYTKLVLSE